MRRSTVLSLPSLLAFPALLYSSLRKFILVTKCLKLKAFYIYFMLLIIEWTIALFPIKTVDYYNRLGAS